MLAPVNVTPSPGIAKLAPVTESGDPKLIVIVLLENPPTEGNGRVVEFKVPETSNAVTEAEAGAAATVNRPIRDSIKKSVHRQRTRSASLNDPLPIDKLLCGAIGGFQTNKLIMPDRGDVGLIRQLK